MKQAMAAAVAAIALAGAAGLADAQETAAEKAQKRQEERIAKQSLDRLSDTRKNLQAAIEKLEKTPAETPEETLPGGATRTNTAIQDAEQALLDVRRAIDDLDVPQNQRQSVLDKLDDADSAMRAARQPDAAAAHERLRNALQEVHKEIEVAQETLPAPPSDSER